MTQNNWRQFNFNAMALSMILLCYVSTSFGASGIVEIYSEPIGAKVYIDGKYVGKTPYQNVRFSTGNHKIEVSLSDDYPSQRWDVTIDSVTPQTKTFYFKKGQGGKFTGKEMDQVAEKHKGNVQFASIPTGASIYINGQLQKKKTPTGFAESDVGQYNIEFKFKGTSLKGHFDIVKDETVKLIADFTNKKIINVWEEERAEEAAKLESEKRKQEEDRRAKIERDKIIVTMPNDGLMFQKSNDGRAYFYSEADNYCRNLTLGGYSNWRLPSKYEIQRVADNKNFVKPQFKLSVSKESRPWKELDFWTTECIINDNGTPMCEGWMLFTNKAWDFSKWCKKNGTDCKLLALCVRDNS